MNVLKSRRFFLQRCASVGLALTSGTVLLTNCDSKPATQTAETKKTAVNPCEDYSGLSEGDLKTRQGLGYVTQSPSPDKQCSNCNLWLPPAAGKACGGCMLFKGPVYATANCTYWAPQVKG
ncbi:high-potential iron-sulfur protein [Larkinella punicea]|uniref:High-potential iron-sulfur protein n=1 Tax=Larkinella punicea TaxID=2315727 RepID=A0A368JIN0_9BACT|nr:high-potential iron-sulfur protein [Larkinella punicea]RCR66534.1 high-potential iron-sulfur protein [Larkinella punicea]